MIQFLKNFIQNSFRNNGFKVYTDGSQKNGWGSWAFVVTKNNTIIHECSGRQRKAGSNQMEFHAALEALKFLPARSQAELFTDSRILLDAIQGNKNPAAYRQQVSELKVLTSDKKITWHWVKAHSGVQFNERCDQLCIQAREKDFRSHPF